MSLLGSVSGFAAFGVLVRTYALGLQKRPLFSNPSGHAIAAAVFGGFGYYVHGLQQRQEDLIESKKEVLLKNRARAEEIAKKQAAFTQ
ncbi:uncharacterized protein BYT42DRAFT_569402 [Radiomyces spectabilis]|uniref:uncharacterized protein n=1 Tax=Radiomyces spectabilis TaxID=64574 RepID=UPI00221F6354|nr:uncharacterized protein BYT42DRAFT_569402 [Radiomyces spectabilis]KAI8379612.1 hypothetical protein BYT42DRAFT_569402 [Radiomyces spectabilis]